jgi:hypothetical protein
MGLDPRVQRIIEAATVLDAVSNALTITKGLHWGLIDIYDPLVELRDALASYDPSHES